MSIYERFIECGCKFATDSRRISGGEIFFALRGENFDGNRYALQALSDGARYAVVNDDAGLPDDDRLVKVADPFTSLRDLAIQYRSSLNIPVIGLTGTNGKTTTKELLRSVLSKKYRVSATQGNFNNDLGVPLTILSIPGDAQMAVVEMGASHPDDIEKLVEVSMPDYGLITNVGKAHLLGFGSFEGVKYAKGALYRWLGSHGGVIMLNADDPDLREMAQLEACHVWSYGVDYQRVKILETTPQEPYLRFELDGEVVTSNLVGSYNINNVLAAIAVGDFFGVPRKDSIAAIAEYVPENARSQMIRTSRNTLIMDAYNANPSSMAAALRNFASICAENKLALLGDMRELGEDSQKEHQAVIALLRELGIKAVLVGEEFTKALGSADDFEHFDSSQALADHLSEHPADSSLILIKGSRGIQMEKVKEQL